MKLKRVIFIILILFSYLFSFEDMIMIDLDNDGKNERIDFIKWKNEYNNFVRVAVYDDNDELLWKHKPTTNKDEPFFFKLHLMECDSFLYPVVFKNENNETFLIYSINSRDTKRIDLFQIYKWEDGGFKLISRKSLIAKDKDSKQFYWSDKKNPDKDERYIVSMVKFDPESIDIDVSIAENKIKLKSKDEDEDEYANREVASGRINKDGFYIDDSDNYRYHTLISKKDHFNSKGVKLTRVQDIIRQDRANYYNNKRDKFDESANIPYFKSIENRKKLDGAKLVSGDKNQSIEDIKKEIINGNPKIDVYYDREKDILYINLITKEKEDEYPIDNE